MKENVLTNKDEKTWFISLKEEDVEFIRKFIIHSGSLKKLAQVYNVSYPTVRIRLDNLIEKVASKDASTDLEYIAYIKELAEEYDINAQVSKKMIKKYLEIRGTNNE